VNPPLAQGTYDVTMVVGGESIVYPDYLDIHGYQAAKKALSLSIPVIDNQDVRILAQTPNLRTRESAPRNKFWYSDQARFADVALVQEGGKLVLKNPSIVTIGSLLARYKDSSGETVLVNLKFNNPIPPMTDVELEDFAHASSMKIINTAPLTDFDTGWRGLIDCDREALIAQATDPDGVRKLCYPIESEQVNFTKILSRIHYFSNTKHALRLMPAWFAGEVYDGIDLADTTYSPLHANYSRYKAAPHKKDYVQRALFKSIMSNHSMHYGNYYGKYKNANGSGSGRFDSLLGSHTSDHLGKGSMQLHGYTAGEINRQGKPIDQGESTYAIAYHEIMHAKAWGHDSGITYGYPWDVTKIMKKEGILDSVPVLNTPKYLFTHMPKANNALSIKVFKTSEASNEDVLIEMLSSIKLLASDYTISQEADDATNEFTVRFSKAALGRFIIMVTGDDSMEAMSAMINPSDIGDKAYIGTDNGYAYYALNKHQWYEGIQRHEDVPNDGWAWDDKYIASSPIPKNTKQVCQAYFGITQFHDEKPEGEVVQEAQLPIVKQLLANRIDTPSTVKYILKSTTNYQILDTTTETLQAINTTTQTSNDVGLLCRISIQ
jgi:hypothetical protein